MYNNYEFEESYRNRREELDRKLERAANHNYYPGIIHKKNPLTAVWMILMLRIKRKLKN